MGSHEWVLSVIGIMHKKKKMTTAALMADRFILGDVL
jgi:hypothetical protein